MTPSTGKSLKVLQSLDFSETLFYFVLGCVGRSRCGKGQGKGQNLMLENTDIVRAVILHLEK